MGAERLEQLSHLGRARQPVKGGVDRPGSVRILTSRATLTFTYDTRNASVDPTSGRELSAAVAVAGLGGDVRTYQPTLSYTQFFPMRRKKSQHPEVFGFRIIAGTVGSFATTAKVRAQPVAPGSAGTTMSGISGWARASAA